MFSPNTRNILIGIFENNCKVVIDTLEKSESLVNILNTILSKGIQIKIIPKDINPEYYPPNM